MTSPHLTWTNGGEAIVLEASSERIGLRSTVSSPPGSRIEGALLEGSPAVVRLKIHACKRQPDGSFLLEGRPLDLTRDLRERLVGLAAQPERFGGSKRVGKPGEID